jgi:hypothetical protein
MRFPESKIKEAIFHPVPQIRRRATRYFATPSCRDVSIMPLVIKVVQTYGREDAWQLVGPALNLPQTEETIDWVIAELDEDASIQAESYTLNLCGILVRTDLALLAPRSIAILNALHIPSFERDAFMERQAMASWDDARCWRELENLCEATGHDYALPFDERRAGHIVEALARRGVACKERIECILAEKEPIEDSQWPAHYMSLCAVKLAGRTQLESLIPLLTDTLEEDWGDESNQECQESLATIGSPAVVRAIDETFSRVTSESRSFLADALATIHSDLAAETCARLFDQEPEARVQETLVHALLSQFAHEGIDAARRLLKSGKLTFEAQGVRDYLLETCTITGERFPEFDEWSATQIAEKDEHERRMAELEGNTMGQVLYALEKLAGKSAADVGIAKQSPGRTDGPRPAFDPDMPFTSALRMPAVVQKPLAGRNDPCPCGSAKKYKKCCGRHPA